MVTAIKNGNEKKATGKTTVKKSADNDFGAMTSAAFSKKDFRRTWLVESVLVDREICVLGGPKKCLKTSLVVDLAISLGSATPFLGHYEVPDRKRVAIFSGETSQGGLQDVAKRICESKSINLARECDILWFENFPKLGTSQDRNSLRKLLQRRKVEVAIVDPLYLALFNGSKATSASNLYEVGDSLRKISQACLQSGATPLLVHHMTKGANKKNAKVTPSGEGLDLDDLAQSGVAEFASQWILVNRRETYIPGSGNHQLQMVVGGSAGHSGSWNLDIYEGRMNNQFEGRCWKPHVYRT